MQDIILYVISGSSTFLFIMMMMMMMMMMMIMNCFYGMVNQRKAFNLISSRVRCQKYSPSRISDRREQSLNLRRA